MSQDISLDEFDLSLLRGGPIYSLLVRAGIGRPGAAGIGLRMAAFVSVTWVALAILAAMQGVALNPALKVPFLYDFSEACRYLFVGPLLIVAEALIEPWLSHVVNRLRRLVPEEEAQKFTDRVARAVRSRDSLLMEVIIVLLAFARPHFGVTLGISTGTSSWLTCHTSEGVQATMASYWSLFIARPLISWLWFRWLWRYFIWSLLLCRISSLALRLTPTHPDRCGGLGAVAVGQSRFAILSFAFAAQVASAAGVEIVFEGASFLSFRYVILGVVVLALLVFVTPLLAFSPKLITCKKKGLFEYGALSDQYTEAFHQKWIKGKRREDEHLIGSGDIQSLADLANSFEVIQTMKPALIGKGTLLAFALTSLIPFAPLLLTVYPVDELLQRLWKMFL